MGRGGRRDAAGSAGGDAGVPERRRLGGWVRGVPPPGGRGRRGRRLLSRRGRRRSERKRAAV